MEYTLDQKIGQMVMIGFRGIEVHKDSPIIKAIRDGHLGGVWLTDNDSPMGRTIGNIESPRQLKQLISDLQSAAQIPLIVSIDAEGGQVVRLKEKYGFPITFPAFYLGQKNDFQLTYSQSRLIAEILSEAGINFNFSPVLDLNRNPDNPALSMKERCYSADPQIVWQHALKVIEAHHEKGIKCCLKHFPGHGSARHDSHVGFVDVTETWSPDEISVYQKFIERGLADAILTAHVFHKQFDDRYPATLSRNIITGLLREKMGFSGIVISDDMNMGAIKNNYSYEEAVELAIGAGVDIILQSNVDHYQPDVAQNTMAIIKKLVHESRISEERIEQSFQRIKEVKDSFQLMS